jgi:hypothetical protein
MSDFVYNIAAGRVVEYAARVNANDPTNAAFVVVAINANGATDAALKDLDTLTDVLATAANEVTNTNYARKTIDQTGGLTITVTDAADKVEVDMPDQTWSAIAAGDAWTDLIICYDSDTTAGTDANLVPLVQLDFAVTPDGSDIIWQLNASGFFRATT